MRPRDVDYGTPLYVKSFLEKPFDSLTGREKNLVLKDKLRYEQWLLDKSEEKVMARRAHIRDTCVRTIYEECKPGISYNAKNSYLEDRIETTMKYYRVLDDLNNVDQGAQMERYKKDMFKIMR